MALFELFIGFFVFFIGLIFGSFLNSYIYRQDHPTKKRRSFCPNCAHKLSFLDLIPIFSFIFLKGRCRYCNLPISWQYPLVELTTGLLFLAFFVFINPRPEKAPFDFITLIYYWLLSLLLIIIAVYDIKNFIVLDNVLFLAIAITFLYIIVWSFYTKDNFIFLNSTLTALFSASFFFVIYFFSKGKWLGFGDVKLAFLIGLSVGFPNILVGLFFAFLVGAIISLGFVLFRKKGLKSQIPFAPFLIAGQLFAIFFGKESIDLYLNFFYLL